MEEELHLEQQLQANRLRQQRLLDHYWQKQKEQQQQHQHQQRPQPQLLLKQEPEQQHWQQHLQQEPQQSRQQHPMLQTMVSASPQYQAQWQLPVQQQQQPSQQYQIAYQQSEIVQLQHQLQEAINQLAQCQISQLQPPPAMQAMVAQEVARLMQCSQPQPVDESLAEIWNEAAAEAGRPEDADDVKPEANEDGNDEAADQEAEFDPPEPGEQAEDVRAQDGAPPPWAARRGKRGGQQFASKVVVLRAGDSLRMCERCHWQSYVRKQICLNPFCELNANAGA